MTSKNKAKPLESAISIIILAILVIIVAVIILRQFQPSGAESIAPAGPQGFKAFKLEEYSPENLYEKIDGKAPLYLEAGFKKLTAQRFVNSTDESLWFENYVYDMSEAKNAFSVYSTQKRSDAKPLLDIGTPQAYQTTNGLYFVKGKFYVEMIASAESPKLLEAALKIAKQMQSDQSQMKELALLEADNLIPDSFQLYRGDAFGFDGFGDLYAAKYQVGQEKITAFVGQCADAEKAKAMAQNYHKFLIDNGGKIKQNIEKELENSVIDLYGSYEIITSAGAFIVGVHEAQDQQQGEKLVLEIVNKLKSGKK